MFIELETLTFQKKFNNKKSNKKLNNKAHITRKVTYYLYNKPIRFKERNEVSR